MLSVAQVDGTMVMEPAEIPAATAQLLNRILDQQQTILESNRMLLNKLAAVPVLKAPPAAP